MDVKYIVMKKVFIGVSMRVFRYILLFAISICFISLTACQSDIYELTKDENAPVAAINGIADEQKDNQKPTDYDIFDEEEIQNNIEKANALLEEITDSTLDKPLSVGDTGAARVIRHNGGSGINNITVNAIYYGDEAQMILTRNGITDKPSGGTEFQVAEYTLLINPEIEYVDIKMTGLDGERLKYQGVSYPMRIYDIMSEMTEANDRYTKLYVYYEVPNGIKEYYLFCGLKFQGFDKPAIYYIENKND